METRGRTVTLDAQPTPIALDTARTAVIAIDMPNDFCSEGGLFDRAGVDLSGIRRAVAPTKEVLDAARGAGV